jgi:hypothetical protein
MHSQRAELPLDDTRQAASDCGMKNEAIAKALAYNLTSAIHSRCELGIEPVFWSERAGWGECCCRWFDDRYYDTDLAPLPFKPDKER